ncbi:hypothetical protein Q5752_005203 [Cryptotrichosporon argae]
MATMAVRAPLAPLPLTRFASTYLQLPSPVSLPTKRAHPPSPFKPTLSASTSAATGRAAVAVGSASRVHEAEPSRKVRRLSDPESDPDEVDATPRASVRDVLGMDDLGVGRSPARRLFADSPSTKQPHAPGLAPSSPIESRRRVTRSVSPRKASSSRTSVTKPAVETRAVAVLPAAWVVDLNGARRNAHDPGFSVHVDDDAARKSALASVRSAAPPMSPSPSLFAPSTPSKDRHNDQENVPPTPRRTPRSGSGATPRVSGTTPIRTPGSASTGRTMSDADLVLASGSRTRERSRLGMQSMVALAGATDDDELTPGRPRRTGKASVKREVDMV